MKFADIKGNGSTVAALKSMADNGRVPHALMFYENPRCGGLALACAFLQYINCEHHVDGDSCGVCPSCRQMEKLVHPDAHFVFPVNKGKVITGDHPVSEQGMAEFRKLFAEDPYFTEMDLYSALDIESKSGNISVFETRSIISKLSLTSITNGYKAVIMFLPERMNTQAANALLKMLEEPPSRTIFLLVTQNPEDVMTTIVSRCQGMRVLPFDRSLLVPQDPSSEICELWDNMFAAILGGNLLEALEHADGVAALGSRDKQRSFCVYASEQLRKAFLASRGLSDIAYFSDNGVGGVLPDVVEHKPVYQSETMSGSTHCSQGIDKRLTGGYIMKAIANIDKAAALIGRNVAAKLVFTDLVNRLYINLNNGR